MATRAAASTQPPPRLSPLIRAAARPADYACDHVAATTPHPAYSGMLCPAGGGLGLSSMRRRLRVASARRVIVGHDLRTHAQARTRAPAIVSSPVGARGESQPIVGSRIDSQGTMLSSSSVKRQQQSCVCGGRHRHVRAQVSHLTQHDHERSVRHALPHRLDSIILLSMIILKGRQHQRKCPYQVVKTRRRLDAVDQSAVDTERALAGGERASAQTISSRGSTRQKCSVLQWRHGQTTSRRGQARQGSGEGTRLSDRVQSGPL